MRLKLILIVILVMVLLVIILQNLENVTVKLLLVSVTMPRALLLFIMAAGGFVVGAITAMVYRTNGKKS